MNKAELGIYLSLFATASWSFCAIMYKLLGKKLDSIGLNTYKAIISSILLIITVFIIEKNFTVDILYLKRIAISAIIGVVIGDSFFFAALKRISPFVLSVIFFIAPVIFSGIFGLIFLKEVPTLVTLIGISTILIGLSFFLSNMKAKEKNFDGKTKLSGIIFAILSTACTVYSMTIIKPILNNISTVTATMYRMIFSAIFLIIFGFLSKKLFEWKKLLSEKTFNLKLTGNIALETFGGFLLSLTAIKYCDIVITSTILALEPLFIIIFMIFISKYKLELKEYISILLTILGITIMILGN